MTDRTRPAPRRRSVQPRDRRRRPAWRPAPVEALEGRALLSLSPLDPAFNGGVPVVSPTAADAAGPNSGEAVAVDSQGRIVVAGLQVGGNFTAGANPLSVLRYNADGSVDATFGAGGRAAVALPSATFNSVGVSGQVLILPGDKVVIAATLAQTTSAPFSTPTSTPVGTVVARLDADGTPDPTFGTNGEVFITAGGATLPNLALQADGKIVLGGVSTPAGAAAAEAAVTRLNADGSTDASFHGGAILNFDPAVYGATSSLAAVLARPSGQVDLVWPDGAGGSYNQVVQLAADGTLDATFGAGGISRTAALNQSGITAAALQPDGKIILGGDYLKRIGVDGSVDASFRTPNAGGASSIAVQADGSILIGTSVPAPTPGYVTAGDFEFAAARFTAAGLPDRTFGVAGRVRFALPDQPRLTGYVSRTEEVAGLALTADGQAIAVGTAQVTNLPFGFGGQASLASSQLVVARLKATNLVSGGIGDYDGDNTSDVAVYLPASGAFAISPSTGAAPYYVPFGTAGPGGSIPVVGDFDGDGKTDIAVYLPASGSFAVDPSSDAAPYYVPFGSAGAGNSIPVVGDFDGDGKTDFAVYLPAAGAFAIDPSSGVEPYYVPFGTAGPGGSIPVAGDFDNNGTTDIAVYLPASGSLAILPYAGAPVGRVVPFGTAGPGGSIPAPGDYDGNGATEVAVYLPASGFLAYIGAFSGVSQAQQLGTAGPGQSVPVTSIPAAQPPAVAASGFRAADAPVGVLIPLDGDILLPPAGRKKS